MGCSHPPFATPTSLSVTAQVDHGGSQIPPRVLQAIDPTEDSAERILGDVFCPFGASGEGMGETDRTGVLNSVEGDKRIGAITPGVPPLVQCLLHIY
jgi:hypothetical protein